MKKIRTALIIFATGLFISGLTAFPLERELLILSHQIPQDSFFGEWIWKVRDALVFVEMHFPFLSYGTDWLAFAHILFAILFFGILKDPIKNKWVVEFGIIACVLILPLALIAGDIRGIPMFWRLIDCSFGILGVIPLIYALRQINLIQSSKNLNHLKTN